MQTAGVISQLLKNMTKKVLVEFLKGDTPYRPGDIVWIEKKKYEKLVKEGKVKKYSDSAVWADNIYLAGKSLPPKPKEEELICPICRRKYKTKAWAKKHMQKKHRIN